MYCKYCGEQIPNDSKFCKFCGKELLSRHSNSNFPKKRFAVTLYFIWVIINVIFLLLGEGTIYEKSEYNYSLVGHAFKSNEFFFPFTSTGYQTSQVFNVKYYDWTEFLVYCLLIPLIIYIVSIIWKSSIGKSINVKIKRLLESYKQNEVKKEYDKPLSSPILNNNTDIDIKGNYEELPKGTNNIDVQENETVQEYSDSDLTEAFKKAIIPSCFFALMGIRFAFVGGIVFFLIGLVICTLVIYVYGKIVPKKLLSEAATIEMCKEYLDKVTDNINENLPHKFGILTLKSTIYNDISNALIFRYDYDFAQGEIDVVYECRNLLEKTLSTANLEDNKMYIACVYVGASFIARIRNHKKGETNDVTMTSEDMQKILSTWHKFGSEYSWL